MIFIWIVFFTHHRVHIKHALHKSARSLKKRLNIQYISQSRGDKLSWFFQHGPLLFREKEQDKIQSEKKSKRTRTSLLYSVVRAQNSVSRPSSAPLLIWCHFDLFRYPELSSLPAICLIAYLKMAKYFLRPNWGNNYYLGILFVIKCCHFFLHWANGQDRCLKVDTLKQTSPVWRACKQRNALIFF